MASQMSPRPPATGPFAAVLRLGTRTLLALAALAAVLLLLLGFAVARSVDLFPSWGNQVEERTVERSEAPLQLSLKDLSEYHAASGTYQIVLDVEQDRRFLPSFLAGERTIFLATGSVDGIVDFADLGPERVVIDQVAKTATITLPAPRIGTPTVDPDSSRVLSRDRGLAERVGSVFTENPGSETAFFQLATERLTEAAQQSDLRRRAETNTRATLETLGRSLGFTAVTVTFEPPPQ